MVDKIEEKKKKLDLQIEKNLNRKKMLLAAEKRQRIARLNEIGKLAYQANIDQIDHKILFGAFLEISKCSSQEKIDQWKKFAEEFSCSQDKNSDLVFVLSFDEEPSQEIKKKLKENKFSWNRFRKEYYGKCQRNAIENLLKDCKVKIDEIKT